jgi:hypothetical protein
MLGLLSLMVVAYYLPTAGARAYWYISRSSGVIGYVLLTLGVLWGLVQSGALFRRRVPPVLALGLHSSLSWWGIALGALHAVMLLGDRYMAFTVAQLLAPFASAYRPIPTGLGIIGFYGALVVSISFYARRFYGYKTFRLLHYGSYGVFVLVTLHGILAGTDTLPLWWLYAGSLAAVVLLTAWRIRNTRR